MKVSDVSVSPLRGVPEVWVVGARGDCITLTTPEGVMREVRDFLNDGCRTITIERQGAPERTPRFLHNKDTQNESTETTV